jgi:hypothetical protein
MPFLRMRSFIFQVSVQKRHQQVIPINLYSSDIAEMEMESLSVREKLVNKENEISRTYKEF